jgi:hypothetical protein
MVMISIPTLRGNESLARVHDPGRSLEYHLRVIELMERQLRWGEDIELPERTLRKWREALSQEQVLVEKYQQKA